MSITRRPLASLISPPFFALTIFLSGCGNNEVSRGAGSIDIPESSLKKFVEIPKGAGLSKGTKAAKTSSRSTK